MAIGIHVVRVGLVTVNMSGIVKPKTEMTIGEVIKSGSELRVFPDVGVVSSASYPTVKDYLEAEAALGYKLQHMDQTYIITYVV